jgi:hypothetical protein
LIQFGGGSQALLHRLGLLPRFDVGEQTGYRPTRASWVMSGISTVWSVERECELVRVYARRFPREVKVALAIGNAVVFGIVGAILLASSRTSHRGAPPLLPYVLIAPAFIGIVAVWASALAGNLSEAGRQDLLQANLRELRLPRRGIAIPLTALARVELVYYALDISRHIHWQNDLVLAIRDGAGALTYERVWTNAAMPLKLARRLAAQLSVPCVCISVGTLEA